jgi:16S rRNA (guanine527-N7)-methyltransferase
LVIPQRAPGSHPDAAAQGLDAVLRALQLTASEQQRRQLLQYLALLERWNQVYNLTAVREPERMLTLHLADSLAVLPALDQRAPRRLLDVGSGGGLPGVVLAIMRPAMQVVLVEAVQKKCAFLRQVAATVGLPNLQVEHARVEQLRLPGFDCITSRALGDLAELVRISEHLLLAGGAWAAMKGSQPDAELQALPADLHHRVEPVSVPGLDARRCLVWLWRDCPGGTGAVAAAPSTPC